MTDNNKCCKLPFEFNNRNYTECTADVTEEDWSEQWRYPWCFPEDDNSIKHPCRRNSEFHVAILLQFWTMTNLARNQGRRGEGREGTYVCCHGMVSESVRATSKNMQIGASTGNVQTVPNAIKHPNAIKRGKISNRYPTREKIQKGAKRGITSSCYKARENIQTVPSVGNHPTGANTGKYQAGAKRGKISSRCEARGNRYVRKPNKLTIHFSLLLTGLTLCLLCSFNLHRFLHVCRNTKESKLVLTAYLAFPLQATAVVESVRKWPELFLLQTFPIATEQTPLVSGR